MTQNTPVIHQDMAAELAALKAENARLKAKAEAAAISKVKIKVSEKGAVSVYGLGRFPVTLYRGQMERLLGMKADILAFIENNSDMLSTKD